MHVDIFPTSSDEMVLEKQNIIRTVSVGKRFRYIVVYAIRVKGIVGLRVSKAVTVNLAIVRAMREAKKRLVVIPSTIKNTSEVYYAQR